MLLQRLTGLLVVAAAVVTATPSCSPDGTVNEIATSPPSPSGDAAGGGAGGPFTPVGAGGGGTATSVTPAFTADQVASILVALELAEVQQAQVALQRTSSSDVRPFAQRMVTEHTQSVQRIQALPGITVSANDPTAALLASEVQRNTQSLQSEAATSFDLAFMTAQIGLHAELLGMLDNVLVPSLTGSFTGPGGTGQADGGSQVADSGGQVADSGRRDSGGVLADAGIDGGTNLVIQALTTTTSSNTALLTELGTTRSVSLQHLDAALSIQKSLRGVTP